MFSIVIRKVTLLLALYQVHTSSCSENYMVPLNMSLSLYNADSKGEARNQFIQFETKLRQASDAQLDTEVLAGGKLEVEVWSHPSGGGEKGGKSEAVKAEETGHSKKFT